MDFKDLTGSYKKAIETRREPFQRLMGGPPKVVEVPKPTLQYIPPPTVWPIFNVTVGPQGGEF